MLVEPAAPPMGMNWYCSIWWPRHVTHLCPNMKHVISFWNWRVFKLDAVHHNIHFFSRANVWSRLPKWVVPSTRHFTLDARLPCIYLLQQRELFQQVGNDETRKTSFSKHLVWMELIEKQCGVSEICTAVTAVRWDTPIGWSMVQNNVYTVRIGETRRASGWHWVKGW